MGLDPLADRIEELALPLGQGDARLVGGAAGASQGVQGRPRIGLALGLERAGGGFGLEGRVLGAGALTVIAAGLRTRGERRPLQF